MDGNAPSDLPVNQPKQPEHVEVMLQIQSVPVGLRAEVVHRILRLHTHFVRVVVVDIPEGARRRMVLVLVREEVGMLKVEGRMRMTGWVGYASNYESQYIRI